MAKKKKHDPKDDLIDQLLDDVNDIAADPSLEDSPSLLDIPIGLGEGGNTIVKSEAENPWSALEGGLADGAPPKPFVDHDHHDHHDHADPVATPEGATGLFGADDGGFQVPSAGEVHYQGPSAGDGGYQSIDDLMNAAPVVPFESSESGDHDLTRPIPSGQGAPSTEDRTMSILRGTQSQTANADDGATVAADGFANRRLSRGESPQEKVVIGSLRGARSGNVYTGMDASLQQAENLKIAQQRILDLERENDRLRQENEEVASAADIIRSRLEELSAKITAQEREKAEMQEASQNEIMILKGNLQYKESEVAKARLKIDELEVRLRNDFKKIRVKERELENRLELARAEKAALVRAKDENILELKRKIDQQQSEIDNYREKLLELNKTIEANQEQFKRTVRALRLALSNLEATDDNVVPLKKAE